MKFRLAKLSDLNRIVNLHYNVRENYSVGFFSKTGKTFLRQYYKILLNDPNEVVLCAEDNNKTICGFASATLDVEHQFENLKKHKYRLALSMVPTFIKNPKLLRDAWSRYNSIYGQPRNKFIANKGARGEYWVWDVSNKESVWSTLLNNKNLEILFVLGVKELNFEVDALNEKVRTFSIRNGAIEIERIILDDGRERILMQYDLKKKFQLKEYKR